MIGQAIGTAMRGGLAALLLAVLPGQGGVTAGAAEPATGERPLVGAAGEGPAHAAGKRRSRARRDSAILRDVRAALIGAEGVDHRKIRVFVNEGIVTLRGRARTARQKALAEKTAARVTGVRLVINQIKIVGPKLNRT